MTELHKPLSMTFTPRRMVQLLRQAARIVNQIIEVKGPPDDEIGAAMQISTFMMMAYEAGKNDILKAIQSADSREELIALIGKQGEAAEPVGNLSILMHTVYREMADQEHPPDIEPGEDEGPVRAAVVMVGCGNCERCRERAGNIN